MPRIRETITFGVELEAVQCSGLMLELAQRRGFGVHRDGTILDETGNRAQNGREIITPVLNASVDSNQDGSDMSIDFGDSASLMNDLCRCASRVNTSCGIHVHLGRPDPKNPSQSKWQPETLRTFLVLGHTMEAHLFDLVPASRRKNPTCRLINECYTHDEMMSYYPIGDVVPNKRANTKRYCWMNLIETQREGTKTARYTSLGNSLGEGPATKTVEIRLLGNTRRFNYIWAWTRFWVQLAAYVAYVPTSLAIARYTVGLEHMLADLREAKESAIDPSFNSNLITERPTNVIN